MLGRLFDSLKTRKFRYGGYATLVTVAVVVAIIIVNLIVQQVPAELDMTESQLFSLSEQTMKVIDSLDQDVTIYGLYEVGNEPAQIVEVLRRYERASDRISLQFIDPDTSPAFVQQYDEEGRGLSQNTVIVAGAQNYRAISGSDLFSVSYQNPNQPRVMGVQIEKRITNALLYIASGFTPVVYQLTGHGERTPAEFGLVDTIEKENYRLESLNLLTEPAVPDDAEALIVVSPLEDITETEADRIREYLDDAGRGFFMVDFSVRDYPVLNDLLRSYGVEFRNGLVMEGNNNNYAGNNLNLVPELANHDILDPIRSARLPVLIPYARPIATSEIRRRTLEFEPLLTTTEDSWIRTNYDDNSSSRSPEDESGPATIAMAVYDRPEEVGTRTTRLVLVGSAQYLGTIFPFGQIPGNIDFFMNSLTWLQNRTDAISIRAKSLIRFPMRLTNLQALIYSGIVVLVIPLGILVAGLVVWLRRRHL